MADDHPAQEPDSSVYQPVTDGEEGPSENRSDNGSTFALSHPPRISVGYEVRPV
jgi:hypothetical protein